MLTLSLLLGAAAGVNAILGGHVNAVSVNETSFFCAEDCAFRNVFFGQAGYFCPNNEVIVRVDEKGVTDPYYPYDCIGAKARVGFNDRPRSSGEEPRECPLGKNAKGQNLYDVCFSYKSPGDGTETVQWSDVEKEIQAAAAAAAPKSNKECAEEGRKIFSECREKSGEFDECNEKGAAAIKSCRGLQ